MLHELAEDDEDDEKDWEFPGPSDGRVAVGCVLGGGGEEGKEEGEEEGESVSGGGSWHNLSRVVDNPGGFSLDCVGGFNTSWVAEGDSYKEIYPDRLNAFSLTRAFFERHHHKP